MNFHSIAENDSHNLTALPQDPDKHTRFLEERIQHLEQVNRYTLDALEMAASLGDFQHSLSILRLIRKFNRAYRFRICSFQR